MKNKYSLTLDEIDFVFQVIALYGDQTGGASNTLEEFNNWLFNLMQFKALANTAKGETEEE